jgi:hypothetical protein
MIRHIASKLKQAIHRELHRRTSVAVLKQPGIVVSPGGPTVVSMVGAAQHLMYLCAIKSFAAQLPVGRVVVLDDGSLTTRHHELIRQHVGAVEIRSLSQVDIGSAPRADIFWERLLLIAELNRDAYVIQLDSDTLTFGALPEVAACICAGEAFTLITSPRARYVSLTEASAHARELPGDHFQFVAERALEKLPEPDRQRYVRGCAAFAGFPPGTADRAAILEFSKRMEQTLGERWHEWGSEQVTSNWVVANAAKIGAIPFPRYRDYEGQAEMGDSAFLHFIGTHRFRTPGYRSMTRIVLKSLGSKPAVQRT